MTDYNILNLFRKKQISLEEQDKLNLKYVQSTHEMIKLLYKDVERSV